MQCVFVSAELEQGLRAQLKSVISRGGGGRALLLRIISRGEIVRFSKSWKTKFADFSTQF